MCQEGFQAHRYQENRRVKGRGYKGQDKVEERNRFEKMLSKTQAIQNICFSCLVAH